MSIKTEIRANTQQATAAFKKFSEALGEIEKQGKKANQSFDNFSQNINKLNEHGLRANKVLNDIAKNTNTTIDKFAHLSQAISGIYNGIGKVKEWGAAFIQTADAINTMNARLKLTTTSTAHFQALKNSINEIARATSSSTESISNLFINLNQSLSEMGLSQKQALEMAQTLSQALKVGGASAVDAERAITQFIQALSIGKLQGQDFKAMIQAAPSLLKNMADALGVTTGEIRQMATDGELTNEKLVAAFANMKDDVDAVFETMPVSVENAMAVMNNSIDNFIENLNLAISANSALSDSIISWADTLKDITPTITAFINEVIGVFAEALIGLKGIWNSFVLAFADFVELVNSIPGLSGNMDVANWLNATRAEHDLSKVAAQIEAVRQKTKDITIKIYDNASAKGDVEALNKTSAVAQNAVKNVEKEVKKAKGSIKAADPLKELVNQLKAQESYYKSINDYASANAKTLQAYEIELSEQIKKQLITREQAEKLYQKKRVELENDTNEKLLNDRLKTLQEEAEFFKITGQRGKELESYYKIADEQAKAFIKKWEVTDKNFIKNINNYFKSENSKSFKSMSESFNENISSMTNAWDNAVDSMAKSISDGLFDLITGKTESLSDAFSKIGKNILGAFVSPLAQSFSDGVGNIFKGLMGGGGSALSAFADDYGLKLENGVYSGTIDGNLVEILTDGSVKTGGSILSSVLGLSESTDNVLSAVSSLKSGVSILTNGITGLQSSILSTTYSPFGFASGLLNDFGATGLGSFVNDFGVGFSNITSFNGFGSGGLGAIFEGTIGQALGAAAGGASVGGLVGSLGDMLFGAKTQASTAGAIGGAIGTAILPGIGTAIGSLLGSIAGSFFGEWEVVDTGLELNAVNLSQTGGLFYANSVMKYEDSEKKGWFSSDEKHETSFIDWNTYQSLNKTGKAIIDALDGLNDSDVVIWGGKLNEKTEKFGLNMDTMLAQAVASSISKVPDFFMWQNWKDAAGGQNVTGYMMGEIQKINATIKTLNSVDGRDGFTTLLNSALNTQEAFNKLGSQLNNELIASIKATELSTKDLAQMYEDGIKQNFTPENINAWNNLINAYDQARQAQMAYTQALRELQTTANNAVLSIKSAFGENVDILSIDALQAQVNALNWDLELPRKSLAELADYLKNMDFTYMSVFLREDTAQKQELINYTLQYAQMGNNALTNLKNAFAQYADTINNLNSQIQNIKENLSKTINDGIKALNNDIANFQKQIQDGYKNIENLQKNLVNLQNQLNALDLKENIDNQKELLNLRAEEISSQLALLKSSKNFAEGLKAIATNLRTSIYSAEQNALFYKQTLQQAKSDYLSGNFDSASLTNLSAAASAYAANLKDKSSSAEQYRFEVLQMANEIEGIAPQSEIARIEASIKALEAQLSNINITLDGLNDLLNNDDSYEAQRASILEQIEQTKQNIENQKIQIETLEASKLLAQQQVEHLLKVLEDFGFSLEIEQGTYENVIEQTEQGKRQIKLLENEIQNNTYLFDTLMSDNHALFSNLGGQFYSGFLDLRSTFDSGCAYIASSVSSAVTSSVSAATAAASAAASAAANNTANSGAALSKPRAFADGGIVTGATNALIGEAGYPEAVIPLKDGAGLKVDMDGGFNSLENRLRSLENRLANILNKIAATNDETARTLRGVSDGEVLYIKGA